MKLAIMKLPLGAFALSVAAVLTAWWWLGRPMPVPDSPLSHGEKLPCVSYAPFRADQDPLRAGTHVEAWQIDEDLARLSKVTNCVRTYSIEHGVDQVPAIAQKYGLKVMQGIWLSRLPKKNREQIDTAIALARRYPDVISAVIVGNEVLLRGELSSEDLGKFIREVKAAVPMPVTYADVWEFWLRNRDLVNAVDFVTVHILPYWEDFPISAGDAAAHVDSIRRQVAQSFPGKEILIGEFGWPSAGRMREGALPSPSNQAKVIQEVLAIAAREHYRVNIIEAFDQPWKRRLEGTVGGYWGLLTADTRQPKFAFGQPVSDHPAWRWQAAGGVLLAALVFAVAMAAGGPAGPPVIWLAAAANATAAGVLVPWTVELVKLQSLGVGGWARWLALAAVALAAPLAGTAVLARNRPVPAFLRVLGRAKECTPEFIVLAFGLVIVATTLLAIQSALGLAFDPRYQDFPFAPLTAAVVPIALAGGLGSPGEGARGNAEIAAAAVLATTSVWISLNEGFANWQALWLCGAFLALAVTLLRVRDAQSS